MAGAEELPDFLKIPKPLQEKFFTAVEEEVNNLIPQIKRFSEAVARVRKELSKGISRIRDSGRWRDMLVCAVDGSDVPALDDRIGVRYGLYAVAYKMFRGIDALDGGEGYFGDKLPGKISMRRETFLKLLDLLTTYYERLTAKTLLDIRKPDLIIVDGSFFGYRAGCSIVKKDPLNWRDPVTGKRFDTVFDLISEINSLTVALLESGRAAGVIKRVPTAAIDGYLCYRYGLEMGLDMSDRSILSHLMKRGEVFDYEEIFGPDVRYDVFTWFRTAALEKSLAKKGADAVLKKAEQRVKVQLVADLTNWPGGRSPSWTQYAQDPVVKAVRSTRRVFIKTVDDIPPICVEFSERTSREMAEDVLAYIYATANPATGLPIVLDLVDDLVSLPRGIGREFVNEIEAELLRRGMSKESLTAIFSRYNPQKDEP